MVSRGAHWAHLGEDDVHGGGEHGRRRAAVFKIVCLFFFCL